MLFTDKSFFSDSPVSPVLYVAELRFESRHLDSKQSYCAKQLLCFSWSDRSDLLIATPPEYCVERDSKAMVCYHLTGDSALCKLHVSLSEIIISALNFYSKPWIPPAGTGPASTSTLLTKQAGLPQTAMTPESASRIDSGVNVSPWFCAVHNLHNCTWKLFK